MRVTSALHVTMRLSEALCGVSCGVSMRKMYVGGFLGSMGLKLNPN
jgi:hypothetical protein